MDEELNQINVIPLVDFEVRVIVPYLIKEKGLKRIAAIYVDDPAGQSIADPCSGRSGKARDTHPRPLIGYCSGTSPFSS